MKRIITDKVSAQNIAEYMINHPEKINLIFLVFTQNINKAGMVRGE